MYEVLEECGSEIIYRLMDKHYVKNSPLVDTCKWFDNLFGLVNTLQGWLNEKTMYTELFDIFEKFLGRYQEDFHENTVPTIVLPLRLYCIALLGKHIKVHGSTIKLNKMISQRIKDFFMEVNSAKIKEDVIEGSLIGQVEDCLIESFKRDFELLSSAHYLDCLESLCEDLSFDLLLSKVKEVKYRKISRISLASPGASYCKQLSRSRDSSGKSREKKSNPISRAEKEEENQNPQKEKETKHTTTQKQSEFPSPKKNNKKQADNIFKDRIGQEKGKVSKPMQEESNFSQVGHLNTAEARMDKMHNCIKESFKKNKKSAKNSVSKVKFSQTPSFGAQIALTFSNNQPVNSKENQSQPRNEDGKKKARKSRSQQSPVSQKNKISSEENLKKRHKKNVIDEEKKTNTEMKQRASSSIQTEKRKSRRSMPLHPKTKIVQSKKVKLSKKTLKEFQYFEDGVSADIDPPIIENVSFDSQNKNRIGNPSSTSNKELSSATIDESSNIHPMNRLSLEEWHTQGIITKSTPNKYK